MKKRKIWAWVFSILYLSPFILGGWYLVLGGLKDSFWGVDNTLELNIIIMLLMLLYTFIHFVILSLILKLSSKRMIATPLVTVFVICLFIIIAS